jgi:hypothetical protein
MPSINAGQPDGELRHRRLRRLSSSMTAPPSAPARRWRISNIINAVAGNSFLQLANAANTAGCSNFQGTLAGNGNITLSNFTTALTTVGANAAPLFATAYGGTITWGSNFTMRGISSTSGGTWNSPSPPLIMAPATARMNSRNAALFIFGGLKSTSFTANVGSSTNGGTVNVVAGSANTDTLWQGRSPRAAAPTRSSPRSAPAR